jgi:hypothetical protein
LGSPGIAQVFGFHIQGFPLGLLPELWLGCRAAAGGGLPALIGIAILWVTVFGIAVALITLI